MKKPNLVYALAGISLLALAVPQTDAQQLWLYPNHPGKYCVSNHCKCFKSASKPTNFKSVATFFTIWCCNPCPGSGPYKSKVKGADVWEFRPYSDGSFRYDHCDWEATAGPPDHSQPCTLGVEAINPIGD